MRRAPVCLLPFLLVAPSLAQTPQRKLVDLLCERYATRGFEIDVDELRIETATANQMSQDIDAQQSYFFSPRYFTIAPYLFDALSLLPPEGRARFRSIVVSESVASLQAYFHYERAALVFVDHGLTKLTGLEPLLAHELAHAWRHLAHDMSTFAATPERTWDQARTLQCLLEGEAELIAMDLLLSRSRRTLDDVKSGTLDSPLAGVAHPVAVLPYDKGREFMLQRYHRGGWEEVHGYFETMPTSSEQVLHPEKLGVDEPVLVELPPHPAYGNPLTITEDTVGEFGILSLLLARQVPRGRAEVSAAGWDGDRIALHQVGDDWLLAWRTVWDRDVDATQFAETFGGLVGRAPRAKGRIVDWTTSNSDELANSYFDLLALQQIDAEPDERDAVSTELAETEILRRYAAPTLRDGVFTYPKFDVSVPAPEGWTLVEQNGAFYVMSEPADGFRDNINVTAIPRSGQNAEQVFLANRTFFESSNQYELHSIEKFERDGTPGVQFEYGGRSGRFELRFFGVILLTDDQQIVVTVTVLENRLEKVREAATRAIGGARLVD